MAHDYGLREYIQERTPITGKPIRMKECPYKKVILVNVNDCVDKITVLHVTQRLGGLSWFEWEHLLANWLVESIVEAIRNGKEEADISKLFTCDLQGEDSFGFFKKTQEQVVDFLMGRLFECLEEDDEVMRVRIIEKSIC